MSGIGYGLLGFGSIFSTGSSIISGITQSSAIRSQGELARQAAERDAELYDMQADDVIRAGREQAYAARRGGKRLRSEQASLYAASNIDVNTGSPALVQGDTENLTSQDFVTITNNAWNQAFGLRSKAINIRYGGKLDESASRFNARQAMISGVFDSIGSAAGLSLRLNPITPRWIRNLQKLS